MDNADRDRDRAPSVGYGPDRRVAAGLAMAAAAFAALAIGAGDAPGRLFYLVAVVVLAGLSAGDLIVNPRLVVGRAGLVVRTPGSSARVPWGDVDDVRVDERSRFGLAARTLEIDADERLIVLSGRSLGTDPRTVAGVIAAFREPGRVDIRTGRAPHDGQPDSGNG